MFSNDLRLIYDVFVKLSQEKNIVKEIESIMGAHMEWSSQLIMGAHMEWSSQLIMGACVEWSSQLIMGAHVEWSSQ